MDRGRTHIVVGSGVAGLAAAYTLCSNAPKSDQIVVIEAEPQAGGHARTIETPNGEKVDIGFMVLNPTTYPNLLKIFEEVGASVEESDMSLSVFHTGSDGKEVSWSFQSSADAALRALRSPRHWKFALAFRHFSNAAMKFIESQQGTWCYETAEAEATPPTAPPTLRDVFGNSLSEDFEQHWLVPMVAAVWSCPESSAMNSPARATLEFMRNHQLLGFNTAKWKTPNSRSQDYVNKLLKKCKEIHPDFSLRLNSPVIKINEEKRTVVLKDREELGYDSVILCCSAPIQAAMNPPATKWLQRFETFTAEIVVHTEPFGVPALKADWSSWNVESGLGSKGCRVTYWLSRLQNLKDQSVFVSLNPETKPPGEFFRCTMDHPRMCPEAYAAQQEEAKHQGIGGVYHAGAWLRHGFHEDGAFTGIQAARRVLADETIPLRYPVALPSGDAVAVGGTVKHTRTSPSVRAFTYPIHMHRFDLRAPPSGFARSDHFGDPSVELDTLVRQELCSRLGIWPTGQIEAVCHLRALGVCFNPITAFFAYNENRELCALLCEVHNTPWEERCLYAMRCGHNEGAEKVLLTPSNHTKTMHVSPFNPPPTRRGDLSTSARDSKSDRSDYTYQFSLTRSSDHDVLAVDVYRGDHVESAIPLEVEPTVSVSWRMGRAIKGARPQHNVSTGSIRALCQVYWQALLMILVFKVPFQAYPSAPPTPRYWAIAALFLATVASAAVGLTSAVLLYYPTFWFLVGLAFWSGFRVVLLQTMGDPIAANNTISLIHALVMTMFAVTRLGVALPDDTNPFQEPNAKLENDTFAGNAIFGAYLFSDLLFGLARLPALEMSLFIHHVIFLIASVINSAYKMYARCFIWLAFGELSTIFLSSSLLVSHKSSLHLGLRTLFAISFFCVRCVLYPFGVWNMLTLTWAYKEDAPLLAIPVVCSVTAGFFVNVFWGLFIWRKLAHRMSSAANTQCLRAVNALLSRWTSANTQLSVGTALPGAQSSIILNPALTTPVSFLLGLLNYGELFLGEAYVRGEWAATDSKDDLEESAGLIATITSMAALSELSAHLAKLQWLFPTWWFRFIGFVRRFGKMDRAQSAAIIHEHYDERVDLYRAFLGPNMVYTSAMWNDGETLEDLQTAQDRKVSRILDLANVREGSRVLDIGSGFGYLVGSAARRNAKPLGVCNSESMVCYSKQTYGEELFGMYDYRDLPATHDYDSVTCVEMIEAVPCRSYPEFVQACDRVLKPGGKVVMQVIHAFAFNNPVARKKDPDPLGTFVTTHIFPGCQVPVLERLHAAFYDSKQFELERSEQCGQDYTTTLAAWRRNLDLNASRFPPQLVRKYRYYLAWCEAGFNKEFLHVSRIVFVKK